MTNNKRKMIAIKKLDEALSIITAIVDNEENEETKLIWDGVRAFIYGFLFESSFKNEIQKIKS